MDVPEKDNIDPAFLALPPRLRTRIDRALDKASYVPPTNTEPGGFLPEESLVSGGFLVDDGDESMGGGFIPADTTSSDGGGFVPLSASVSVDGKNDAEESEFTHIPFDLIPRALQLLDLQPDDPDVLDVFRNAASGWEGASRASLGKEDGNKALLVSRKDWRAVCAALLDTSVQEVEDNEGSQEADLMDVDESEALEEEYVDSDARDSDVDSDASDDEYQEGGFVRSTPQIKGTRKGKGKAEASSSTRKSRSRKTSYSFEPSDDFDETRPRTLTARQKAESRRTFALFFPSVPDSDLDGKRIMIKDLARVADLLKEKITANEIVEMLEAFSTSPDKSMSLSDFETMMVVAKLA
ncbi:hypothetical protein BDY19DRAFT_1025901 [Irpex rosettiformis]|uniref:Uncharacterized protein n=1 Tax=Irpex rosettiformis TaxID=378272 RepID=A0ACB8TR42_9APHY|nr:hypothetical protein BDY19DRAFT_1025901 [Irpex rosettiformis]